MTGDDEKPLSAWLKDLPDQLATEQPTLGCILSTLEGRSSAFVLVILSIPAIVPTPGVPAGMLFGTVMFLVGLQMLIGMDRLMVPGRVTKTRLPRVKLEQVVRQMLPLLQRSERLLTPRVNGLCTRPAHKLLSLTVCVMAILIALPIPFGNVVPGFAVLFLALGHLHNDGLAIAAGFGIALIAILSSMGLVIGSWWLLSYYWQPV